MVMNVEHLLSQATKSKGYKVTVGGGVIVLIIIVNIEWAASQDWGGEFRDAMQNIRQNYSYNKVHTSITCAEIDT